MTEFWESNFQEKQEMWGLEPADSALLALELFQKHELKKVLIPGFGYGRNARVFIENRIEVTGIEISETAIALAKKHYGNHINVFHGSVTSMPFDEELYDGIFCYALIHLLDEKERSKLIHDCYEHLKANGLMTFVALSTSDPRYGGGKKISKDRFITKHGVRLFFYDSASVKAEFERFGLIKAEEINEPRHKTGNKPLQRFWQIVCKKQVQLLIHSGQPI